jgi:hypothetical protein
VETQAQTNKGATELQVVEEAVEAWGAARLATMAAVEGTLPQPQVLN